MAALGVLLANAALVIWFIIRKRNKGLFFYCFVYSTIFFRNRHHFSSMFIFLLEIVESMVYYESVY